MVICELAQVTNLRYSPIIPNRFDRATRERLFARCLLSFIFRLFTDEGIRVLERASEIVGGSFAAHIAIDAGRVDVERTVCVLFNSVFEVRHESADYADFKD